jgi:hypothetical protein
MSLLSSDDISFIAEHGAPEEPRPEFVIVGPAGSIQLSEYGLQYYRLALIWYGMRPACLEHVRDLDDLRAISLRIQQVRLLHERDIAERERQGGRIPVRARAIVHAVRFGTLAELDAAIQRRLLCEECGENVIPGLFRKRT